MKTRRTFF